MSCSCCSDPNIQDSKSDCIVENAHSQTHDTIDVSARMTLKKIITARFVISAILFGLGLGIDFWLGIGFSLFHFSQRIDIGLFAVLPIALYLGSWFVSGYTVLWAALKNSFKGNFFDENFLMTIATLGAFFIGQWSEAAAVMLFYNLGEIVQESAVHRSKKSITDLLDVQPDTARLARGDTLLPAVDVSIGSIIRVLPGERVPLDGIVIEGNSFFDTAALTGESMPREARFNSIALAGYINGTGPLLIKTTTMYSQTAASKMLDLIKEAQGRKSKSEKLITRFSKIYTPFVTFLALALSFIPPIVLSLSRGIPISSWQEFLPWMQRALVFLVISCPCAFVLSVPLGFFGGIGGAAKKGILVKGADTFDMLAKARTVVFDKTGTLTKGKFQVQKIEFAKKENEDFLISLAYTAEKISTHPLARSIVLWIEQNARPYKSIDAENILEHSGLGIRMEVNGRRALVGSRTLLLQDEITGMPTASKDSSVEIAYDGVWLGRILLQDTLKAGSQDTIQELAKLGIKDIIMLTGDNAKSAQTIADKLGIVDIRSDVLPHQKVEQYEKIQKEKKAPVIFVGDGINDAAVIARSDVGIAMGAFGSDAAIEAADLVLMNDSPLLVSEAIRTARWTHKIVGQNIALAFLVKIGFLALGSLGLASLWEAVFADVGVALLATLNSLRASK